MKDTPDAGRIIAFIDDCWRDYAFGAYRRACSVANAGGSPAALLSAAQGHSAIGSVGTWPNPELTPVARHVGNDG